MEIMARYSQKKAAQVAAFFANAEGGCINVLKLVKLIYLSDRGFMEACGAPILYDNFYSLDHGPVVSRTYDLIQGNVQESAEWDEWISARTGHEVAIIQPSARNDLDELSDAEFEAMSAIWDRFGHLDQWQLCAWTHANCREWKDPHGSSLPFDYEDVFVALGKSRPMAEEMQAKLDEDKMVGRILDTI